MSEWSQKPKVGFDFEVIAVSNTAITLTALKYQPTGADKADSAFITLEGGDIRYRYDGTAPTATVGHLLSDGGFLVLIGQNQMEKFKAIRVGGRDGSLSVTYERI
jgi:hypothetical protein